MPLDPNNLPDDAVSLRRIVLDLAAQLERETGERHKLEVLLRELLDARKLRKSERLSDAQLALFEAAWEADHPAQPEPGAGQADGVEPAPESGPDGPPAKKRPGRQPLARHLPRERVVHDLPERDKHCGGCNQDLRHIGEDTSERYEYVPASLRVVEDVCLKYACECTVRTAGKPPQPIEKSTAGASLLSQVIVAKYADHLPLHRQEGIFARHGAEISRKTMGGWMAQCAELLEPVRTGAFKLDACRSCRSVDSYEVSVLRLPYCRTVK